MIIFDIVRHGIEDEKEYLSKEGGKLVEYIASHIDQDYTDFLTSPYLRCRQTLKVILKSINVRFFKITPWLCTRYPEDWNSLISSSEFRNALDQFGTKLDAAKQIAPSLLFRDAYRTFISIQRYAKGKNFSGKILAISHNLLISTTAGLFRTNSIFDQEFDNLSELSGARILIDKNYQTSRRLTVF